MEPVTHLPTTPSSADPAARDLAEIDAAIGLVASGMATRIRLVGLARSNQVAAIGLARAQAAGLTFEVDRTPDGPTTLTIGPRGAHQRVG
jgi:hypothetical protein